MGAQEHPETSAEPDARKTSSQGDIVDTQWDIPPILFPGENPELEDAESAAIAGASPAPSAAGDPLAGLSDVSWPKLDASAGAASDGVNADADAKTVPVMTFDAPAKSDADANASTAPMTFDAPKPADPDSADGASTVPAGLSGGAAAPATPAPLPEPTGEIRSGRPGDGTVRKIVIPVAAVVAVAAVTAAGVMYMRSNQSLIQDQQLHHNAFSMCTKAVDGYSAAQESLDKAVSGAKDARAVTAAQVIDAKTVDTLKNALLAAQQSNDVIECKASQSTDELRANAKKAQALTSSVKKDAVALASASKSVTDSKNAKDLATTLKSLNDTIPQAQTLLDSSAGVVADDSTRTALQKAIDTASKAVKDKAKDVKALESALKGLNDAISAVNTSMSEYTAQQNANANANGTTNNNGNTANNGNAPATTGNTGAPANNGGAPATNGNTTGGTPSTGGTTGGTTDNGNTGNTGNTGGTTDNGNTGGSTDTGNTGGTTDNGNTDSGNTDNGFNWWWLN